jgi:hypothetical protein
MLAAGALETRGGDEAPTEIGANSRVSIASSSKRLHDRPMGSGRTDSMVSDLFSKPSPREQSSLSPGSSTVTPSPAQDAPRHVLPSDLPAAIKHLGDHELEQLQAAVAAEQQRRGKITPASEKTLSKRVEAASVSLTRGKLNAVLAAFKAGVTPARIARGFGIPQSDVRKVIAGLSEKEKP